MKHHVTIGIAGHVDHGKTSLVKALTGVDTDRMTEEKKRGVSIESGVAPWRLSEACSAALIDVPGHTDYLKNTLRGLSCVDMAILVVAADDGVMPQTREHLEALRFFGASGGIVVLSKTDLVDDEVLDLAEMEISELVSGTFLEKKPVVRFSALDQGCAAPVRDIMLRQIEEVPSLKTGGRFRLWIDQARSVNGFGTVVSGTVLSGKIHKDDAIRLQPSGLKTRARFIEIHGERFSQGLTGQRVGINLHKIPFENIKRGMLVTDDMGASPGSIVNAEIHYLKNNFRPLISGVKIRLHTGTLSINARTVIIGNTQISPGEDGLVQFRLETPAMLNAGDRFVIVPVNRRMISGGGRFLEITDEKYTHAREERLLPGIRALRDNDIRTYVQTVVRSYAMKYRAVSADMLSDRTAFPKEDLARELADGVERGDFKDTGHKTVFDHDRYQHLLGYLPEIIVGILKANPAKTDVNRSEIMDRLEGGPDTGVLDKLLDDLCSSQKLLKTTTGFYIKEHISHLPDEERKLADDIMKFAETAGIEPFSAKTFLMNCQGHHNMDKAKRMLHFLHHENRLIRLNNKRFIGTDGMDRIREIVKRHIESHGHLTIGDSPSLLGYGRTKAVQVFEFLDKEGLTIRDGEHRILR